MSDCLLSKLLATETNQRWMMIIEKDINKTTILIVTKKN